IPRHAAAGVDNDLASGQARIAEWTADHESTGWIDEILGLFVEQVGLDDRLDDVPPDIDSNLLLVDIGGVLRRNHHRVNASGLAVAILDGHLALAVRSEPRQ